MTRAVAVPAELSLASLGASLAAATLIDGPPVDQALGGRGAVPAMDLANLKRGS